MKFSFYAEDTTQYFKLKLPHVQWNSIQDPDLNWSELQTFLSSNFSVQTGNHYIFDVEKNKTDNVEYKYIIGELNDNKLIKFIDFI